MLKFTGVLIPTDGLEAWLALAAPAILLDIETSCRAWDVRFVDIQCAAETRFQPNAQMLAELEPPASRRECRSPWHTYPTGTCLPPTELAGRSLVGAF